MRAGLCLHSVTNCDEGMPDDEEAIIASLRVWASKWAKSSRLMSSRSGAFWKR